MAQYTLTNLLSNSSFENTGWGNTAYCTLSYDNTIKKYGNYSLKVTATRTSSGEVYFANSTNVNMVQNHIYYTRCELYQTSSVCSGMQAYWPQAEPNMGSASVSETNKWVKCSFRASRTNWSGSQNFRFDIENIVAPNYVYLDGAMLVDLTEAFGSGNEPSIEWCDSNIKYFEGTKTISVTFRAKRKLHQVEYLESSGTQYIDTGLVATNNTKISIAFERQGIDGCLIATDTAWCNTGFGIWSHAGEYGNTCITSISLSDNIKHTVVNDKGKFYIDGSLYTTLTADTFSTAQNLYLFALNRAGSIIENYTGKFYSCQIYDNDVLVRDFVPVIDGYGKVCLYDKVTQTFFYNGGSGTFTCGADVDSDIYTIVSTDIGYAKVLGEWKPLVKWFAKVNGEWKLGV